MADIKRRFGGVARLYGQASLANFQKAHICIIGVGGVGSWAVEALARSGVGALTLIDLDNVCESNTNRQVPALDPYFGMPKVTALAERVLAINPECKITPLEQFVEEDTLNQLLSGKYDYIIDAIDNLKIKIAMAKWCMDHKQPFIVSGSAGGQTDPCLVKVADLSKVTHDPLLAKLRYALRRHHGFNRDPRKTMHIPCIYSTETITYPEENACKTNSAGLYGLSCAGLGASVAVTATFGLVAAARALAQLKHQRIQKHN